MATASEASQQANRSGIDPRRLVVIFYMVTALVAALFLSHLLDALWGRLGWPPGDLISGLDWTYPNVLAVVLAVGAAIGCYAHPKVRALSLECSNELMKVTWPTWGETRVATIAVVVASIIASLILFGIDTVAYRVMVEWLPKVWGKL